MSAEPELSIDAIIDQLTALSAERERESEAIRFQRSDGRDAAATFGMAVGIMQAVRHIESMRLQAANERARVQAEIEQMRLKATIERTRALCDEMGLNHGRRKRGGDV